MIMACICVRTIVSRNICFIKPIHNIKKKIHTYSIIYWSPRTKASIRMLMSRREKTIGRIILLIVSIVITMPVVLACSSTSETTTRKNNPVSETTIASIQYSNPYLR